MRKIIRIFIIIIVFILFNNYCVQAEFDIDGAFVGSNSGLVNATKQSIGTVIKAIAAVATAAAVIVLLYLAIKYMTSAPSGRADVAKTAVPYIIGVIVLFGSSTIISIISGMVS